MEYFMRSAGAALPKGDSMTTAIIGATGRVGGEIVRGVLERGDAVAAPVRDPKTARCGSDTHFDVAAVARVFGRAEPVGPRVRPEWTRARRPHAAGDPGAMTNIPNTQATDGAPIYLGRGDSAGRFADYYPAWVDNMAANITLEGSLLDGALQGADAVRVVIAGVRQLYDRQNFNFAGPWGDNSLIEDYTAEVLGRPLGSLHLVTFNADGQAQHIAANYRPLSSLMFFSRLLREGLAGTPYADHFLVGEA
jgi:NAD(P)-dependent dehydrogenase (short-subunit alcohol dehydrogenase family)